MNQYNELLNDIARTRKFIGNSEIPLETHHSIQDRCYWIIYSLWLKCRTPLIAIGFVLSLVLSCITLFTECTTILFNITGKSISPFSWSYSASITPALRVLFAYIFLIYVSACYFLGFFSLQVPFLQSFNLYPHHTDVYALSSAGIALCRCQFSLFYHFFTLFQLPESAYNEVALSKILGEMQTIPLLGTHFNSYMPVLVVAVSVITLVWGSRKKARDVSVVQEGKQIVDISLRRLGMGNNDLENEVAKGKLYVYRDVVYKR